VIFEICDSLRRLTAIQLLRFLSLLRCPEFLSKNSYEPIKKMQRRRRRRRKTQQT
jgi:hypothetical protein